jgi:hypothetical protein
VSLLIHHHTPPRYMRTESWIASRAMLVACVSFAVVRLCSCVFLTDSGVFFRIDLHAGPGRIALDCGWAGGTHLVVFCDGSSRAARITGWKEVKRIADGQFKALLLSVPWQRVVISPDGAQKSWATCKVTSLGRHSWRTAGGKWRRRRPWRSWLAMESFCFLSTLSH